MGVEWYTPSSIIEAARATMGGIDLDPASSSEANAVVKASRFYSKEEDGLNNPWKGNVWLNPPFGAEDTRRFVSRLIEEYENGNVPQGCLLVPFPPSKRWMESLLGTYLHCHPFRVMFWRPGGAKDADIQFPLLVFYIGKIKAEEFTENFCKIGTVCCPLRRYSPQETLF